MPSDFRRGLNCAVATGVAVFCATTFSPAVAQHGPPASVSATGVYHIAGTVVSSVTGEPVRGATVAVLTLEDSRRIAVAQSGNDGRFTIAGLSAGKFQLTASKRGYSTSFYNEHEQYSSAVVTGAGQDTDNIVFRLAPGAVLRGVVTSDGGDPVAGAQAMLFAKPEGHSQGGRISLAETSVTDDTGAYEFSNLHAGEYLLAVKAEPWYALHHAGAGPRRAGGGARNSALDVAFPITYFDSTTEEASASPIVLAAGSQMEANVSLHAVPAVRLKVDAPRKSDGSIARPELKQYVFGTEMSSQSAGFMDAMEAEFAGVGVGGGYELVQGDPPRVGVVDLNAGQQIDPGAGVPAVALAGTLETARGAPFNGDAVVTLEPADGSRGLHPMETGFNQGAFSFPTVAEGTWKLRAQGGGVEWSIATGGRVQKGNLVTVADRPLTLVVRLNAGSMRVGGMVRKNGKGASGVMVLLVPKDAAAFPESVRRDQSDSDGSFAIKEVAPGQYTLLAIEDGWTLDWTRPEVIGRYLPGGTAVTVTDTVDKVVRIATPIEVQMR